MAKKQKLTKKQMEARAKAAEKRERRQKEAQERASKKKQIFTIVVCVILVLALGLPTVGLALCSSQQVEQAAQSGQVVEGDTSTGAAEGAGA